MGEPFYTHPFSEEKLEYNNHMIRNRFTILDFLSFVWTFIHEENIFLPLVEDN
tara:strand:+ start:737 stop:895 length:159 start_codon:yes stop_codon:yes gene_type:complete